MRELPRLARAYLDVCYLLGLTALGWLVFGDQALPGAAEWPLAAGLALFAAVTQLFVVARAGGHHSDHLTPAPLFAAFLLLSGPPLALVVVLAFLPEWIWYRRRWFIQTFNIASWLIAAALAREVLFLLTDHTRLARGVPLPALAVIVAIPVFLGTQTLVLAWALKLARGQSFRESGLYAPAKLFVEVALLCSGWAFAAAWVADPLYGIAAAVPLALIFQALHVPNLKEEASTDPKTGLANMRHFNAMLARDLERSERSGQPFSLLMCDLDYLRNINNTYGHQAGDVVLRGIADIIRHNIRGCDLAGRFGGEEFVVLLADTDSTGARQVAERLRRELEQSRFEIATIGEAIGATVSIGVATFPGDGRTAETLMRESDLAVYQAKRDGRNRVVVAGRASRELAAEWARDNLMPATPGTAFQAARASKLPFWDFIRDATRLSVTTQAQSSSTVVRKAGGSTADRGKVGNDAARPPSLPRPVAAFIASVLVGGAVALLVGLVLDPPAGELPWAAIALFAGLTIVAEQLAVDIHGRGKTSVSAVAVLAASFLFDDLGIVACVLAFAIWAKLKARSPLHRMFFNLGNGLLAAESANRVFRLLVAGPVAETPFEQMILPAIAAGLVYYGVNHLLLCLVRGLAEGRRPWQIWLADYHWLWRYYAVLGLLGLVVAVGYVYFGWTAVIALASPVAMMRLAIKQFMDRTAVYVDELQRMNARLSDSYEATLLALSRALDTRDEETEEHSQRVRRYLDVIARRHGVPAEHLEHISRGALLHDIGKIGVPDSILLKPGRLDEGEFAMIRRHPTIGYSMIAHIPFLTRAAEIVLHHHEAYDGTGYPSGLSGERIPLGARLFAVVDTFDAMTSDRPYRKALSPQVALAEIARCRGSQFDPRIVDTLLSIPLDELMAAGQGIEMSLDQPSLLFRPALQPVEG